MNRLATISCLLALGLPGSAFQIDLPGRARKGAESHERGSAEVRPAGRRKGLLDLPDRGRRVDHTPPAGAAPGTGADGAPGPPGGKVLAAGPVGDPALAGDALAPVPLNRASALEAANFVWSKLALERDPNSRLARSAVENLTDLEGVGLASARPALASRHLTTLVTAARVLLSVGTAEDRAAVLARIDQELPPEAGEILVQGIVRADPVLASPERMVGWLDHPSGEVRRTAQRMVHSRMDTDWIAWLAPLRFSKQRDTRLRVYGLLSELDDPTATTYLLDGQGDVSAAVAALCAQRLSLSEDPEVVKRQLELAFDRGPLDRLGAYSILSLAEREDRDGQTLLIDRHVPSLLFALRSNSELVSGVAAIGLAGIGFRSPDSRDMGWLDLEVPHFLVRLVSGAFFHPDFSSLRDPARRRLVLLVGYAPVGDADGPAWQTWWMENAETFTARRAALRVGVEDADGLVLRLDGPGSARRVLAGPLGQPRTSGATMLFLTSSECRALFGLLEREGVFEARRLPIVGRRSADEKRVLVVRVGDASKTFEVGEHETLPWFERIAEMVDSLAAANRWQYYFDPLEYPDQRAFWVTESEWWRIEKDPLQRARRMKELLFAHAARSDAEERDRVLLAFEELTRIPEALDAADYAHFVLQAELEPAYGQRVMQWLELALFVIPRGEDGRLDSELGSELFERLLQRFGTLGTNALVTILEQSDAEALHAAALSPLPLRREVAARALARAPREEERGWVFGLLSDQDLHVEREAVHAIARLGGPDAREALVFRAREGRPEVRAAALLALADDQGSDVREALLIGLAEKEPRVRMASIEALSVRGDPQSLPLFVSIFARGTDSPLFRHARVGLAHLGERAHAELLRLSQQSSLEVQREAALLLAEEAVPEAAPILLSLLTANPRDERVAAELVILTCIDLRGMEDPPAAWWEWWELVVHDDAAAWLCGAAERAGFQAPEPALLRHGGTRETATFLANLMERGPLPLRHRAARELGAVLGAEPAPAPFEEGSIRDWRHALDLELDRAYEGAR